MSEGRWVLGAGKGQAGWPGGLRGGADGRGRRAGAGGVGFAAGGHSDGERVLQLADRGAAVLTPQASKCGKAELRISRNKRGPAGKNGGVNGTW